MGRLSSAELLAKYQSKVVACHRGAQIRMADALAYFNVIMFWLRCPVFSTPTSILLALWLKRSK